MKKILGILIFICLFFNNIAAADFYADHMLRFNKWLSDNGHDQYLDKESDKVGFQLDRSVCKDNAVTKDIHIVKKCYGADGSIIPNSDLKFEKIYPNNLNIKINKKKNNLDYESNPNRDTLIYYLWNYSYYPREELREFKSKNNSYDFKFNLIEDKYVKRQMKTKGILSYLYYQDGEVLIDEFSPKERLGKFLNNETKFYSMSMGKSVTSYILGHAICDGFIDGVDAKINDWPVIKNTLYHNQKLIDFLNMSTGDQKYINDFLINNGSVVKDSSYFYEGNSIFNTAKSFLKGSVKSKSEYYYNGFVTQLILNYIKFKTGEDYDKLYSKIFNDKVKIKHSIFYGRLNSPKQDGNEHPNISSTRFDYLRLAKAIMEDYQNDTCVGKYLKEIHKRRIPKKYNENKNEPEFNRTKSYGGQFHMDYPGLRNRIVFGMGGYGGQAILIDVENSRIVVLNSLHYNNSRYKYNVKKLLIDPIKNGK
ncbi:hypothetical protein N8925_03720 [Candidatus Pelagibacter sp.]|nr:hypothetical protein [Candidatus Pelagibacter sp.]